MVLNSSESDVLLDDVLEDFLNNFPKKENEDFYSFLYRTRVDLKELSHESQKNVYEKMKNIKVDCDGLLFFSHPSFEVFQAFLNDERLFGIFVEYLDALGSSRKSLKNEEEGDLDLQILAEKIEENDFLKFFPELYKDLLLKIHGNKFSHFYLGENSEINLLKAPDFLSEDIKNKVNRVIIQEIVLRETMALRANRGAENHKHQDLLKVLSPTNQPNRDKQLILDSILEMSLINIRKKNSPEVFQIEDLGLQIMSDMKSGNFGNWQTGEISDLSQFDFSFTYELDYQKLYGEKKDEISAKIETLTQIEKGMLPIGLKIHCLNKKSAGVKFLKQGQFSMHNAGVTFNLPPVGSFSALKQLMSEIEKKSGVNFFNHPDFQIQVCFPGELDSENAALLRSAVYISAPELRHFSKEDLVTSHQNITGRKLTIYGAGVQNSNFEYWESKEPFGVEKLEKIPERIFNRTDMTGCKSLQEVEFGQFIATLLTHAQFGGFWGKLGKEFKSEYLRILGKYDLSTVVKNDSWIKKGEGQEENAEDFFYNFEELYVHLNDELNRFDKTKKAEGIIFEIQNLIKIFREMMENELQLINL